MTCARREAGARRPVPSTSAGAPRRADARPGRARARLFGLLPVLALLLGALGLLSPAPAEAQTPTLQFASANGSADAGFYAVNEVAAQNTPTDATITVTISPALSSASSVKVTTLARSTATPTADYIVGGLNPSGELHLPAGATSASFTLRAVADHLDDDALLERVFLQLEAVDGAPYAVAAHSFATPSIARITIYDNSRSPAQQQQSSDATLSSLTATSSATAIGTYASLALTAVTGTDGYTATGRGDRVRYVKLTPTVTETGATVKVGKAGALQTVASGTASQAIEITAVETVIQVVVTAPDGNTTKTYTVTVTVTPSVEFAARNYFINEVATGQISQSATVTLNISPALSQASSITVAGVSGTTAVTPADYTLSGLTSVTTTDGGRRFTGTLTLPQGESSASFTVTAVADMVTDGVENLHLELEAISGAPYVIGLDLNEARVAILDNSLSPPNTPSVSLSVSSSTVAEGSDVTLRATLSSALTSEVVIPIKITGLNTETGDYSDLTSITIASGASYGEGTITANQDADTEDETFTVAVDTASLPAVVRGSPNLRTVTIIDDDATTQPPSGGVWSSTFDVTKLSGFGKPGCQPNYHACSTALSATQFTYGSTTYTIEHMEFNSVQKELHLQLDKAWPTSLDDAKLQVGSQELSHDRYSGTRKLRIFTMDPAITLPASGTVNMKLVLAQTVTPPVQPPSGGVWSSTFDVTKQSTSYYPGCEGGAANACSSALSADTFEFGGTTYTILLMEMRTSKKLYIELDRAWPAALDDAKLVVGSRELPHNGYTASKRGRFFTMDPVITLPSSGTVNMKLVLAQTVTPPVQPPSGGLWSATLTVDEYGGRAGCRTGSTTLNECSDTSTLTDDDFVYSGTTYTVTVIQQGVDGSLAIVLDAAPPAAFKRDYVLHVGSASLALSSSVHPAGDTKTFRWTSPGFSWSEGQSVALSLVETTPPTSVTLSVDNANPAEGETVTVTVELDQPAPRDYTVPLVFTLPVGGVSSTASGDDITVGSQALVIQAGERTATTTIAIVDDAVEEPEETIAISLNAATIGLLNILTPSVTTFGAGVVVTIQASDGATPACDAGVTWCATLTVPSNSAGCTDKATCDSALTDNSFRVGGTDYHFITITAPGSGFLNLNTGADANAELKALNFCVGTTAFSLSSPITGSIYYISAAGLSWSPGDQISLSIASSCGGTTTPTVSLSASSTTVAEGSSVTVTAELSEALTSTLEVPATVSLGTAESGDYDIALWVTEPNFSFVFDAGTTTETLTFAATQDDDTDDETFTVALDSPLPSGVAAGAVTSLDFTITDDDATTQPPSGGFWSATLTVDEGSSGDFGCHSADSRVATCADTNVLTDDDFTYGGKSYTIRQILRTSSALVIGFDPTVLSTDALRTSGVTFGVDGSTFAFSAGTWADNNSSVWWTSGLPTWTDGQSVSVRLSGQAVTPPTTTTTPGPATGVPHKVKVVPAGYDGGFWVYWEGNSNRDAKWNMHEVEWRLVSYGEEHGKWPSDGARPVARDVWPQQRPRGGATRTTATRARAMVCTSSCPSPTTAPWAPG